VSSDAGDQGPQEPEARPVPLAPERVAEIVRQVLDGYGAVIPSAHFGQRGRLRDFTTQDALEILRSGVVVPRPVWNERVGAWNYDIIGVDVEGEPLTVRIAVSPTATTIILVTAF
jgi:hypothetical protein